MDDIMKQVIQEELQKCKENPYYFATTYLKIYDTKGDSYPYTTHLTKEEFNKLILYYGCIKTS